jgi:hypothetical protein
VQPRTRHQGSQALHLPAGGQVNSSGDMTTWVVPSRKALFSCNTTWPARLRWSRSLAMAGRVM